MKTDTPNDVEEMLKDGNIYADMHQFSMPRNYTSESISREILYTHKVTNTLSFCWIKEKQHRDILEGYTNIKIEIL